MSCDWWTAGHVTIILQLSGGSWSWTDGSSWGFTPWACCCGACMPDNRGGIQNCLVINFEPWKFGAGHWDDAGCDEFSNLDGFFCQKSAGGAQKRRKHRNRRKH